MENNVKNVRFIKGDLFESVTAHYSLFTIHCFDCIVSNPPYIRRGDIQTLQREIREYEPIEALDGGEDGLNFYRRILKDAPEYIKEKGIIILEIGFEQADDVLLIANKAGFGKVDFIKDYSGIERICIISR
jgi:release factor glutamine methyltransferase